MSEYGEPWTPSFDGDEFEIKAADGEPVLFCERWEGFIPDEKHRQRITSCVNALANLNPAGITNLVSEVERVVAVMRAELGTYHDPTNILPTLETALRGVKG